jgi:hypothetical protein
LTEEIAGSNRPALLAATPCKPPAGSRLYGHAHRSRICCAGVAGWFEEPLGSLEAFLAVLKSIANGERPPYAFYCALLYTAAGGADARIARYLEKHWEELDGLTGGMGVRASALPCAALFTDPARSRELLRVQLSKYLPPDPDEAILTDAFRGMADALNHCRSASQSTRLDCLRPELIKEHDRLEPHLPPGQRVSAEERLQEAGAWSDALHKVLPLGTSIAAVISAFVK